MRARPVQSLWLAIAVLIIAGTPTPAVAQRGGVVHKATSSRYDPIFRKYSKRYFSVAFDWRYFKAQAMAESDLDPTARSRVGARGLMQLMPSTFEAVATHRSNFTSIDDPEWNIAAGILHDRDLWMMWSASVPDSARHPFMFGTYNAGEGPITPAGQASNASRRRFLAGATRRRWATCARLAATMGC
jgi:membrane-bound lytic murein transglycosylase F